MAVNPHIKFSVEDYKNLAESETERYELLGGELFMTPSPTWRHQAILLRLANRLQTFAEDHGLGQVAVAPLDVVFSEHNVAQPDILFISAGRVDIVDENGDVRGAPDLVVEILSPSTLERDRTTKRTLYARYGVQEYWLVDPNDETIDVLSLTESGYARVDRFGRSDTLTSPLLPELAAALADVFDA